MQQRGWAACDYILVSGDAYVDHSSFGTALIARLLEAEGFKVGIIARPDWNRLEDFQQLGTPKLAFLVSSGNLDSMISNYTAARKKRSDDDYAPGGQGGGRPNRAVIVYSQILRRLYGEIPIIIGGVEASLRRLIHYDYWDDALRNSILSDSQADILIYGMAERAVIAVARGLAEGQTLASMQPLPGTAYITDTPPETDIVNLPDLEAMRQDKRLFAQCYRLAVSEENPYSGRTLVQKTHRGWLVVNPPAKPLTTAELDRVYELPYERRWHPSYDAQGGVPALAEVEFSLTGHRGCFGGCAFCSLNSHQGRIIQCRSEESILREAELLITLPGFKGYIHDLSGPSANFRQPACTAQKTQGACPQRQCLSPQPCPHLEVSHDKFIAILRKLRALPGVRKVFVRSGLRYDYLLLDKKHRSILKELCEHHISGQLKVAPEHISIQVTRIMGKPPRQVFDSFRQLYAEINAELGRTQYLVPYFISSHPGCGLQEAVELAEYLRDIRFQPQQVQDFIPTPGSMATAMYYSGVHPISGETLTIVSNPEQRRLQRALLQYRKPENRTTVLKALRQAGREDLIGRSAKALIKG